MTKQKKHTGSKGQNNLGSLQSTTYKLADTDDTITTTTKTGTPQYHQYMVLHIDIVNAVNPESQELRTDD